MINVRNAPFFCLDYRNLDYSHFYCSRAFIPLLYVKGNSVAFIERLEPGCIDSRVMNEYISTIFLLNEAIAFAVVKPLNSSISHDNILLSQEFSTSQTGGCPFDKWIIPAERDRLAD
jgi:hypothetical protein